MPMNYVLIIHEVTNYQAWKTIFDEASTIRKEAGELSYQVLTDERDSHRIVHLSVWDTLENARRFFESPQLVRIRIDAGVKAPDFIYLKEIEKGVL